MGQRNLQSEGKNGRNFDHFFFFLISLLSNSNVLLKYLQNIASKLKGKFEYYKKKKKRCHDLKQTQRSKSKNPQTIRSMIYQSKTFFKLKESLFFFFLPGFFNLENIFIEYFVFSNYLHILLDNESIGWK